MNFRNKVDEENKGGVGVFTEQRQVQVRASVGA
jgi:hypothetical protein